MGSAKSKAKHGNEDKYYDAFVQSMASQEGKVFVITGTTTGTGLETAKALVSKGAKVLCLNRPSERATSSIADITSLCANGGSAEQVDCDLQDFATVRAAADAVKQQTASTGINVLVNNAGVMALAAKSTKDGYEIQMQTNHLSHFLLTSLLMPSLEQAAGAAGEARVVNHSSGARNMPASPMEEKYMQPFTEGVDLGDDGQDGRGKRYQQTKLANTVFTMALQEKLVGKGSKVKAIVAHPGVSTTALATNTSSHSPGSFLDNNFVMGAMMKFAQGQGDGALPLMAASTAPDAEGGDFYTPSHKGVLGMAFGDCMTGPPKKLDWDERGEKEKFTKDPEGQKLLWECSEAATGAFF